MSISRLQREWDQGKAATVNFPALLVLEIKHHLCLSWNRDLLRIVDFLLLHVSTSYSPFYVGTLTKKIVKILTAFHSFLSFEFPNVSKSYRLANGAVSWKLNVIQSLEIHNLFFSYTQYSSSLHLSSFTSSGIQLKWGGRNVVFYRIFKSQSVLKCKRVIGGFWMFHWFDTKKHAYIRRAKRLGKLLEVRSLTVNLTDPLNFSYTWLNFLTISRILKSILTVPQRFLKDRRKAFRR